MQTPNYHPRIYPANYPLLDRYGEKHPAVRALQLHGEACDFCVGKEIYWPQFKNEPVDQLWFSATRHKEQSFSAFAYEFLSYDLVLDGWLDLPPQPTASETTFLVKGLPLMRRLLNECQEAASVDGNTRILPLIQKAVEFVNTYEDALIVRFRECGIAWKE